MGVILIHKRPRKHFKILTRHSVSSNTLFDACIRGGVVLVSLSRLRMNQDTSGGSTILCWAFGPVNLQQKLTIAPTSPPFLPPKLGFNNCQKCSPQACEYLILAVEVPGKVNLICVNSVHSLHLYCDREDLSSPESLRSAGGIAYSMCLSGTFLSSSEASLSCISATSATFSPAAFTRRNVSSFPGPAFLLFRHLLEILRIAYRRHDSESVVKVGVLLFRPRKAL